MRGLYPILRDLLKEELPVNLARVVDVEKDFDPLEWRKFNAATHPNWSVAAKKILLVH